MNIINKTVIMVMILPFYIDKNGNYGMIIRDIKYIRSFL